MKFCLLVFLFVIAGHCFVITLLSNRIVSLSCHYSLYDV